MLTTTFQNIRKHRPCESGYRKLAKALGGIKSYGDATPIPILKIIETNGIDDALWCFRTVEDKAAVRLVEVGFLIWLLADPEEGVIRFVQGDARTRQREAIEGVIKLLIREKTGWAVAPNEWDAARAAAGAANEIQGAAIMREKGLPFFFLPMFGIDDPAILARIGETA